MNKFISLLSVALVLMVSGCTTSGFKEFYRDETGGRALEQLGVEIPTAEPRLVRGTHLENETRSMYEDGYRLLGYSSFNGPIEDEEDALEFGKTIRAEVVIVYSSYSNTVTGSTPISTPTTQTTQTTKRKSSFGGYHSFANIDEIETTTTKGTQTTYVPYSISRYNQTAQYWVKLKTPIFGIHVVDLEDSDRIQIGTNKGFKIHTVIKGSPAYESDFIRGDIIQKIDGKQIVDAAGFFGVEFSVTGKLVQVEGFRGGVPFKKNVKMNQVENGAAALERFFSSIGVGSG